MSSGMHSIDRDAYWDGISSKSKEIRDRLAALQDKDLVENIENSLEAFQHLDEKLRLNKTERYHYDRIGELFELLLGRT